MKCQQHDTARHRLIQGTPLGPRATQRVDGDIQQTSSHLHRTATSEEQNPSTSAANRRRRPASWGPAVQSATLTSAGVGSVSARLVSVSEVDSELGDEELRWRGFFRVRPRSFGAAGGKRRGQVRPQRWACPRRWMFVSTVNAYQANIQLAPAQHTEQLKRAIPSVPTTAPEKRAPSSTRNPPFILPRAPRTEVIAEELVSVQVGTLKQLPAEEQARVPARDVEAAQSPDHTVRVHTGADRLQPVGRHRKTV